jgi:hypothetical protein
MRQILISKRCTRSASWPEAPLRPGGRDSDIVKAPQLARRPGSHRTGRGHAGRMQA